MVLGSNNTSQLLNEVPDATIPYRAQGMVEEGTSRWMPQGVHSAPGCARHGTLEGVHVPAD